MQPEEAEAASVRKKHSVRRLEEQRHHGGTQRDSKDFMCDAAAASGCR